MISLVTTVLNDRQGCLAFFQQMEAQTLLPNEIVIVDGGSNDGTWELLQTYQTTKGYTLKVIQDLGCNVARGRNIAIAESTYDLIVSTDVGCLWESQWLEELAQPLLDNPDLEAVMGSWQVRWQDLTSDWAKVEYAILGQPQMIATPQSHASSRAIAYRQSLWSKIGGYPEDLTLAGDDMVFALLLHQVTDKVACAPIPRCYWERPVTLKSFCKEARRNFFGGGEAGIWVKHGLLVGARLSLEALLLISGLLFLLLFKSIGIGVLLLGLFFASFSYRSLRLVPAIKYLPDFGYWERWRRIILFEYSTKFWGIIGYWKGFIAGAKHCTECRERLNNFQLKTIKAS
jgi:glycosyltransferase involved in cell wall biosynthesis